MNLLEKLFPNENAAPWIWRVRDRLMSRCRVCRCSTDVISYDPRGLWAYPFRRTWCPDHDYVYGRYDGHYCNHAYPVDTYNTFL